MPYIKMSGIKTHIPDQIKVIIFTMFPDFSYKIHFPYPSSNCYQWSLLPPLLPLPHFSIAFILSVFCELYTEEEEKEKRGGDTNPHSTLWPRPQPSPASIFWKSPHCIQDNYDSRINSRYYCQSPFSIVLIILHLLTLLWNKFLQISISRSFQAIFAKDILRLPQSHLFTLFFFTLIFIH